MKILIAERQKRILEYLDSKGFSKLEELALLLQVSVTTIQRDVIILEQQGLLIKISGGIKSIQSLAEDDTFWQKQDLNFLKKQKIAKFACEYLGDNDYIFIDNSTTSYLMLPFLRSYQIKIITNSIDLFLQIKALKLSGILTGGELMVRKNSLIGPLALDSLEKFNFSKIFIGTSKISINGIYTTSLEDAEIKQKVISLAKQSFILADSSKFMGKGFCKIIGHHNLRIISDSIPPFRLNNVIIAK
ncbi:DeoR/GlpR family DNA-binding transcription regulator [Spiroplasma endosymbiont of Stenodema calcarata]|uniref:DeoR/GlpR family DNA-binding transcription regulator n=1 Tax=Spiroplasma endosymbiont of Stenodema calcarata TaxID=3139328 RepID=UPI003CCB5B0A